MKQPKKQRSVLCVNNDGCEDLELQKIYQVLPDQVAAKEGYLRICDESGEDYLYHESYFVSLKASR